MRIENKDILGYMAKDGKEEKEVCPTCFDKNNETANKDDVITTDSLERNETTYCDDCGNKIG